jgi:hypothetical protein
MSSKQKHTNKNRRSADTGSKTTPKTTTGYLGDGGNGNNSNSNSLNDNAAKHTNEKKHVRKNSNTNFGSPSITSTTTTTTTTIPITPTTTTTTTTTTPTTTAIAAVSDNRGGNVNDNINNAGKKGHVKEDGKFTFGTPQSSNTNNTVRTEKTVTAKANNTITKYNSFNPVLKHNEKKEGLKKNNANYLKNNYNKKIIPQNQQFISNKLSGKHSLSEQYSDDEELDELDGLASFVARQKSATIIHDVRDEQVDFGNDEQVDFGNDEQVDFGDEQLDFSDDGTIVLDEHAPSNETTLLEQQDIKINIEDLNMFITPGDAPTFSIPKSYSFKSNSFFYKEFESDIENFPFDSNGMKKNMDLSSESLANLEEMYKETLQLLRSSKSIKHDGKDQINVVYAFLENVKKDIIKFSGENKNICMNRLCENEAHREKLTSIRSKIPVGLEISDDLDNAEDIQIAVAEAQNGVVYNIEQLSIAEANYKLAGKKSYNAGVKVNILMTNMGSKMDAKNSEAAREAINEQTEATHEILKFSEQKARLEEALERNKLNLINAQETELEFNEEQARHFEIKEKIVKHDHDLLNRIEYVRQKIIEYDIPRILNDNVSKIKSKDFIEATVVMASLIFSYTIARKRAGEFMPDLVIEEKGLGLQNDVSSVYIAAVAKAISIEFLNRIDASFLVSATPVKKVDTEGDAHISGIISNINKTIDKEVFEMPFDSATGITGDTNNGNASGINNDVTTNSVDVLTNTASNINDTAIDTESGIDDMM